MATSFVINIDGSTYGLNTEDFHSALKIGFLHYYARNADMEFRFVTLNAKAQVYVRTKEIWLGGANHARGQQVGNVLYLHNGWCGAGHGKTPGAKWFSAIGSLQAASSIVAHEFWHYLFGSTHSNNTGCLTHINASATDLCEAEKIKLQKRYGKPKPIGPFKPEDVNKDGLITSADVLQIINNLNSEGPHKVQADEQHLDVNRDGFVTSADVLSVINCINSGR